MTAEGRMRKRAPTWIRWRAYKAGSFVTFGGELYVAVRDMPAHWRPEPGGRHFWRHIPRTNTKRTSFKYLTREIRERR